MIKLILGIGIPGSGKTTILKVFAQKHNYEYICTDDVRSGLNIASNDPLAGSDNPVTISMWNVIRERTKEALKNGKTVVVDATFTNIELRKEFIELARKNGANKVQGVFLDIPSEVAWERTKQRDNREVPEHVFKERVKHVKDNPPQITDGFDSIFTIKEYEDIFKMENKIGDERKSPYKSPLKLN